MNVNSDALCTTKRNEGYDGNLIVINAAREETRVALLENRTVTGYISIEKRAGNRGNVYKGKTLKFYRDAGRLRDIGHKRQPFSTPRH
jgi:hypothetical protein